MWTFSKTRLPNVIAVYFQSVEHMLLNIFKKVYITAGYKLRNLIMWHFFILWRQMLCQNTYNFINVAISKRNTEGTEKLNGIQYTQEQTHFKDVLQLL